MTRRLRTGLYTSILIPAPKGLMRTAESSSSLSTNFSPLLENMLPDKFVSSALQKRYGTKKFGDAITGETITSVHDFVKSDGSVEKLFGTDSGKVFRQNVDGTHTEVHSGLTSGVRLKSTAFNDSLLFFNGEDENLIYDGSTFETFKELVEEGYTYEWVAQNQFKVFAGTDISSKYAADTPININSRGRNLEVTSITRSGTTATVTTANNHNLASDALVRVSNVAEDEYNKLAVITVTGANTFTYEVSGSPTSPASAKTAPIKFVKGETEPVFEFLPVEQAADKVFRTTPSATGLKVTLKKGQYTIGATYDIEYREKGGAWVVAKSKLIQGDNTGFKARVPEETVEILDLDRAEYEVRLKATNAAGSEFILNNHITVEEENTTTVFTDTNRGKVDALTGELSSLTRSGNTATATVPDGHGLETGDYVTIFDVAQAEYGVPSKVTVTSDTQFTYEVQNNPATPATPLNTLPTTIVYEIFDNENNTEVSSSSYSSGELTVTLKDNVMPAEEVEITRIMYQDSPPAFSLITPHKDRLFALAGGETNATTFKGEDGTKVYYCDLTGTINTWFNATTQEVNFFNTSTKFPENEELVSIQSLEDALVIIGRNATQLWLGSDPTVGGDLSFVRFFRIGALSGDVVLRMPNEVVMATKIGFRSISKVFQTDGLSVREDIGSNIDPSLLENIREVLADNTKFKEMRSFYYQPDGLIAFKINGQMFVFSVTDESKGWSKFSGLIADAECFHATTDNLLVYGSGEQPYVYANGVDGTVASYDDDGAAYRALWRTPWVETNRRLAGKYFELVMENTASAQTIDLRLYRDNNDFGFKTVQFDGSFGASLWGVASWGTSSWGVGELRPTKRFKWVANSFSLAVTTNNTSPLRINGIRVYGQ